MEVRILYWIISILGVLFMIAPFVLGFSANTAALWTCIILGVVVALAAGYKAVTEDQAKWESIVAGIAGVLAVLAPFVLGFSNQADARWSSIMLGAAVAILSVYQYWTGSNA